MYSRDRYQRPGLELSLHSCTCLASKPLLARSSLLMFLWMSTRAWLCAAILPSSSRPRLKLSPHACTRLASQPLLSSSSLLTIL